MHNNYHFLKHLSKELSDILSGATLNTCFSQEKDELIIGFNKNNNEHYLKCTLKPEFSCLTLQNEFARARKNTVSLWEQLYQNKVVSVSIFEYERAIKIMLENGYLLIIKLFGNRPNLLVFKDENQIVIFNNSLISDKEIQLSYFKKEVDYSFECFQKQEGNYRKVFFTFGKNVFQYLDSNIKDVSLEEKWNFIQLFLEEMKSPTFYVGSFKNLPTLALFPIEECTKQFESAIEATNYFYGFYQKEFSFASLKTKQIQNLQKLKEKTESYVHNTELKLKTLKTGESKEIIANILMANLHNIPESQNEVELLNFYNNQNISIKLKTELSPQKNAENYYRKSKNERIEIEAIERNIETAISKIFDIENQIEIIENTENFKDLKGVIKSKKKLEDQSESDKTLFKEYPIEGHLILVGKNAKNNDLLTLKHAQKEDYWLHARDCPGSHVVIRRKNKENLPNHIIEFAASLAAYYSKRKNELVVPVIITQKKFIRKTKGLPDGQMIVDKESTIMIEPYRP